MKKKLLATAALLTASVSAFSFTACGEQNTGDGLDLVPSDSATATYVELVLETTEQAASTGVSEFSAQVSLNGSSSTVACDANGNKTAGVDPETKNMAVSAGLLGLWNSTGDADITLNYSMDDASGNYAVYLREGNALFTSFSGETIDLTQVTLSSVNISDLLAELTGVALPEISMSGDVSFDSVSTLALRYGAVKRTENSFTIDFDKALASLVKDLLQTINGLNANTTVGEIVASNAVKNLVETLGSNYTAEQFYGLIVNLIGMASPDMASGIIGLLPAPAETDESVYDYIVSLINNQQFSATINTILGIQSTDVIAQAKLSSFINDEGLKNLKKTVNDAVKMQYKDGELTLNLNSKGSNVELKIKDLGISFTVNSENCITAVSFNCGSLKMASSSLVTMYYTEYYLSQSNIECGLNVTLNLNSQKSIADLTGVEIVPFEGV